MKKNTKVIIISLILLVILLIILLFVLYSLNSYRNKLIVTPVVVPYAVEEIPSGTKITKSMIGTIEVVPTMIKNDVITDEKEIIGKYVNDDTVIPKGSLFFKNMITES